MPGSYEQFEASSLFCPRCRKAVAVRKKLLLVLPTGTKYDYLCAECGAPVGGKMDQDPAEFRRTVPSPASAPVRPFNITGAWRRNRRGQDDAAHPYP